MARVQIESFFFSSPELNELLVAWSRKRTIGDCIGALVLLWHYSQEKEVLALTREQLDACFISYDGRTIPNLVKALIKSKWLTEQADGTFLVRGNPTRVERVRYMKEQAKSAAKNRWDNTGDRTVPTSGSMSSRCGIQQRSHKSVQVIENTSNENAERNANAMPTNNNKQITNKKNVFVPNTDRLFDAAQEVSSLPLEKIDAKTVGTKPKPSRRKADDPRVQKLVDHWHETFRQTWGTEPTLPTANEKRELANVLASLNWNVELTQKVISAYVQLKDAFLVKMAHPLKFLPNNVSRLKIQVDTGLKVTEQKAKQASLIGHNRVEVENAMTQDTRSDYDIMLEKYSVEKPMLEQQKPEAIGDGLP